MTFPRHRLLALVACALLAACPPPAPADAAPVTLLIWEEFLSPRATKVLKNQHGITLRQITFTTAAERDELLARHAREIDLVVADTSALGGYAARGLLERIDARRIPNLRHALSRWQNDMNLSVPYLWGHTGIAWRTDLLGPRGPSTYAGLFALAKASPGKVGLLDDAHEALMAARFAFDKPPYELRDANDVKAAERLLRANLGGMRILASVLDETAPLVTGEVVAMQAYNGDIAYLRDTYKVPLAFAAPSPGCMIWQESFLLLKTAPNKDAAYRFLNEINDAVLAAKNAAAVRYATSNALAVQNLEPAFRDDPVIRPTLAGLDHCYFYPVFDSGTQAAIDAIDLQAP